MIPDEDNMCASVGQLHRKQVKGPESTRKIYHPTHLRADSANLEPTPASQIRRPCLASNFHPTSTAHNRNTATLFVDKKQQRPSPPHGWNQACSDHGRILSSDALNEFCRSFLMETPLLCLDCPDDGRHEKPKPSRGAHIVICHRNARRRHAHRRPRRSLRHRGKHWRYSHGIFLHNAQSTTRHRQPNMMTNVVIHML